MNSRSISTTAIKFGKSYEPDKMRVFVQHVERLTSEMQRIQQLLSGGQTTQVLTKTAGADYLGTWADATGGGGFPNAFYLVTVADPDLPNARAIVAGDNITFDLSVPGELRISASGGGGSGTVETVQPGVHITVDATDPANPIVGLDGSAQTAIVLAGSAVQPGDLEAVAFTGDYEDMASAPPYRIVQAVADVSYMLSQLKKGRTIIAVTFAGSATVRLPHELAIDHLVSVKDEAGTGDIEVVLY